MNFKNQAKQLEFLKKITQFQQCFTQSLKFVEVQFVFFSIRSKFVELVQGMLFFDKF